MNGTSFRIEYGVLTKAQIKAGHDKSVVCNLNIVLLFNDKPIGNIIGNKVILGGDGKYYFSSNSNRTGKGYFNFTGFDKATKDAIIAKALKYEKEGTLLRKWSARFEYNPKPKALKVGQDGGVEGESKPVEGSAQGKQAETPAFPG
jgi:hypothetical protein